MENINIGGAIINNNETVSAIKEIQEGEGTHVKIVEDVIDLLLSQSGYIQESSDNIMQHMSDLNLVKKLLQRIQKTEKDE